MAITDLDGTLFLRFSATRLEIGSYIPATLSLEGVERSADRPDMLRAHVAVLWRAYKDTRPMQVQVSKLSPLRPPVDSYRTRRMNEHEKSAILEKSGFTLNSSPAVMSSYGSAMISSH